VVGTVPTSLKEGRGTIDQKHAFGSEIGVFGQQINKGVKEYWAYLLSNHSAAYQNQYEMGREEGQPGGTSGSYTVCVADTG
jgi:hypothetical protein